MRVFAVLLGGCLTIISVMLTGCGSSDAETTVTTTTATTTTLVHGSIKLVIGKIMTSSRGSTACSFDKNIAFASGVVLNITADSFGDRSCPDVDCDSNFGTCAEVVVTMSTNSSAAKVDFRPLGFDIDFAPLCDGHWQEQVAVSTSGDVATLCSTSVKDVTLVHGSEDRRISDVYNAWYPNPENPKFAFPIFTKASSFQDPRKRCKGGSGCWTVPSQEVCPSGHGECTLDPTCKCGAGMVKATIVAGNEFDRLNLADRWYDTGAWCWRCDQETHVPCAELHTYLPEYYDGTYECTLHSCDCAQEVSWPTPVVKQTWYTNSKRTDLVPRNSSGVIPCYTCGGKRLYYSSTSGLDISYEVTISVYSDSGSVVGGEPSETTMSVLV